MSLAPGSKNAFFDRLDKRSFFSALGLNRFPFLFFETVGDHVLRSVSVRSGRVETLIEPWSCTREQARALASPELPVLMVGQPGYRLGTELLDTDLSLAREALPYPFDRMVEQGFSSASQVSIFPAELSNPLKAFSSALQRTDLRLATHEIGALWVKSPDRVAVLLSHQFGRRRVRLGSLASDYLSKVADLDIQARQEYLNDLLGTSVDILNLDVKEEPNLLCQLEHLGLSLDSLEGAPSGLDPLPPSEPELTL